MFIGNIARTKMSEFFYKKRSVERGTMNPFGNAPKQVEQYDLNGKLVAIFNSLTEATKKIREENNKANISNISACCNGMKNNAYGFIWKFKERN